MKFDNSHQNGDNKDEQKNANKNPDDKKGKEDPSDKSNQGHMKKEDANKTM